MTLAIQEKQLQQYAVDIDDLQTKIQDLSKASEYLTDEISHLQGTNEELKDKVKRVSKEKDEVFSYHQDLITEMEAKHEEEVENFEQEYQNEIESLNEQIHSLMNSQAQQHTVYQKDKEASNLQIEDL